MAGLWDHAFEVETIALGKPLSEDEQRRERQRRIQLLTRKQDSSMRTGFFPALGPAPLSDDELDGEEVELNLPVLAWGQGGASWKTPAEREEEYRLELVHMPKDARLAAGPGARIRDGERWGEGGEQEEGDTLDLDADKLRMLRQASTVIARAGDADLVKSTLFSPPSANIPNILVSFNNLV
jgi:hypothetical protein